MVINHHCWWSMAAAQYIIQWTLVVGPKHPKYLLRFGVYRYLSGFKCLHSQEVFRTNFELIRFHQTNDSNTLNMIHETQEF